MKKYHIIAATGLALLVVVCFALRYQERWSIEVLEEPYGIAEASGIEWSGSTWVIVDDEGFVHDGAQYEVPGDLEGIAKCGDRYYIAREKSPDVKVLNEQLEVIDNIRVQDARKRKNRGMESIACFEGDLLIAGKFDQQVLRVSYDGVTRQRYHTGLSDISGLDVSAGRIIVLSDATDMIYVYNDQFVLQEQVPLPHSAEWEGVKFHDGILYVVKDYEDII